MTRLTHVDAAGAARMVDVSHKPPLKREAVAEGEIRMARSTLELVQSHAIAKGNVLATARVAGIQAAKKTGEWIPMCHPLGLTGCDIDFEFPETGDRIVIRACARVVGPTGVEMEALTAVSAAALTIYDMCKAVDKAMEIGAIRLVSKSKKPWIESKSDPNANQAGPA